MSPIPDDELISAYLDDELSREERLRAEQLLLDRADLRRLFEELRGLRQGLRSLPKFSLGEEFSAAVLRKAERSVLQSNLPAAESGVEADASKRTEAPAGRDATPAPASSAAATSKPAASSGPAMPVDRSRLLRPIIYTLTALAAALALVIYEQVNVLERREAQRVAQAPPANADGEKIVGDGKEAGRKENETAPTAEGTDKAKEEKAGVLRKNVATIRDARAPSDADHDTAFKPGDAADRERPAAAFAVGNTFGGNATLENRANTNVPMPSPASVAAKGDSFAATGLLDAATLEGIAAQDFERFQSLIYNSRLPQTKRADGLIDAGRLQEFAASAQFANLGTSQNNLAIDNNLHNSPIASNSNGIASPINGNLAAATDAAQRQQSFAGAGVAQQTYGATRGYSNLSFNGVPGDNGNFVVVVCDVEPEAIEEFSQLLPRVQIADVSLNKSREGDRLTEKLQAGGALPAGKADEREIVKQEAAKSDLVAKKLNENGDTRTKVAAGAMPSSNDIASGGFGDGAPNVNGPSVSGPNVGGLGGGGAARAAPGSRMAVVDEVRGRAPASGLSAGMKSGDAQSNAPAMKATDQGGSLGNGVPGAETEQEFEYFRVVANRQQLESALKVIRSQPSLYRNVSVEPAAREAAERAQWQAYNRGSPLADSKSELAANSTMPALAGGAIADPKQTQIAPGAMPVAAMPAPSRSAPVVAGPTLTLPAAPPATAAAAAPASPPAAKAQVAAQLPASQPVAPQELRSRAGEQGYESQQQRRGYAFSRSQRISGREIAEQGTGLYSVFNPAGEPTQALQAAPLGAMTTVPGRQDLAAGDLKKNAADKLPQTAMKEAGASSPGTGGSGEKATSTEGRLAAKSAAPAAPAAIAPASPATSPTNSAPAPVAAATSVRATPKPEADSKPLAVREAQRSAKDGGNAQQDSPTIAPMTSAALLQMPAASPVQVLDDVTGANRPLPLVQQPEPQLPPSVSTIRNEQARQQDQLVQEAAELPEDYHEALFIFRVVKRGSTSAAPANEASSPAKPAAATTATGK